MRRTIPDRLALLEQKQNQQRERILQQAVQRLVAIWEVTPKEARDRFREFIDNPRPVRGAEPEPEPMRAASSPNDGEQSP